MWQICPNIFHENRSCRSILLIRLTLTWLWHPESLIISTGSFKRILNELQAIHDPPIQSFYCVKSGEMTAHFPKKNLWYFHSILGLAEKELFVNWIFANHIVNELIRWDKIISTLTSAKYKLEITRFIDYDTLNRYDCLN